MRATITITITVQPITSDSHLAASSCSASNPERHPDDRRCRHHRTVEDPIAQIERLAVLRDKGIISSEEFDHKKADLLGRM